MSRAPLSEEQKQRKREREREWRAKNAEAVAAKNARYRAAHPNVFKDYYAANREQRTADAVAYQRAHPEQTKAKALASYHRKLAAGKPVRGTDPEPIRRRAADRRALKKASGGRLPRGTIPTLMELQRGLCAACGAGIRLRFHIDHIQAIARGGKHEPKNLQLLCPPCNLSKHAKDPIEWRQSLGQLL